MSPRGLIALAALMVTGCASLSDMAGVHTMALSGCHPPQGVVLIIGAHRNAPAPSLDQRLKCQVTAAISDGKQVLIVVAAGQPKLIIPKLASVHGGTLAQQDSPRVQQDLQRVQAVDR